MKLATAPDTWTMLAPSPSADAPKLLIIDDEDSLRVAVLRWFTRRGWWCIEAATLADAERLLFAVGATPPDAIICDQNLPDGTADELLARIDRDRPQLAQRMILASGEVFTDEKLRRLDAAGCRTLPKPFDLSQAELMVREVRELRTSQPHKVPQSA
jgi:DNA-binding NtrC family response regulator